MNSGYVILFFFLFVIAAGSAGFGMALWEKLTRIRRLLNAATEVLQQPNQEQFNIVTESKVLSQAWKRYSATFVAVPGERQKTERSAREFFRDSDMVAQELNLRFYLSLPNILVGLGVLGTFVGLVFGIDNFDTQSVEGVRNSISVLLSGMSTAFYTSIAGMVCSIAFNFFEKMQLKSITILADKFTSQLDERFLMTRKDRDRIENMIAERQIKMQAAVLAQVLTNLFAVNYPDGTTMAPAYVLRDLKLEAEEQTRVLKAFAARLADRMGFSIGESAEPLTSWGMQGLRDEFDDLDDLRPDASRIPVKEAQESMVMVNTIMKQMQEHFRLVQEHQVVSQEELKLMIVNIRDMLQASSNLSNNLNRAAGTMNELIRNLSENGKK